MQKIIYTVFTGSPTENEGGPNNVIFKILNSIDYNEFYTRYLSKNYDFIINKSLLNTLRNKRNELYFKNILYRKIVSSSFYLRYHFWKGFKHFCDKAQKINDDYIIHSHDVLSFYSFRNKKQKKILTIHSKGSIVSDFLDYHKNDIFLNSLINRFKEIELESVEKADIITFPSIASKNLFINDVPIQNENKIKIIYNGINKKYINQIIPDSKYFKRTNNYDIFLLNVADHIKTKNIDLILNAIKILKEKFHKNVYFINLGTGPLTKKLLKLSNELEIKNNIRFLGRIPNEEIIKLMKECDYFISPSSKVIFDIVIIEALACGAKVIASNIGGNKEIIKDGINGYLIDNITSENIAKTIIKAESNNLLNPEFGIDDFEINKIVNDYVKLYKN